MTDVVRNWVLAPVGPRTTLQCLNAIFQMIPDNLIAKSDLHVAGAAYRKADLIAVIQDCRRIYWDQTAARTEARRNIRHKGITASESNEFLRSLPKLDIEL